MQLVITEGSIRDTVSGYKVNVYTTQNRDEVNQYSYRHGNFLFSARKNPILDRFSGNSNRKVSDLPAGTCVNAPHRRVPLVFPQWTHAATYLASTGVCVWGMERTAMSVTALAPATTGKTALSVSPQSGSHILLDLLRLKGIWNILFVRKCGRLKICCD